MPKQNCHYNGASNNSNLKCLYFLISLLNCPSRKHKVHIYLEYHSVFPSSESGPPTGPPPSECVPSPEPKGGHTRGWGGGGSPFRRLEKKPNTLSTLCRRPTMILYLKRIPGRGWGGGTYIDFFGWVNMTRLHDKWRWINQKKLTN